MSLLTNYETIDAHLAEVLDGLPVQLTPSSVEANQTNVEQPAPESKKSALLNELGRAAFGGLFNRVGVY